MKNKYDVIVVGAGAAGMTAAISAARAGANTAILEHMEEAGKKLLATGNGKCNFTNQVQGVTYYRGQDPAFVLPVLKQFGHERTLAFFKELGIWPKEKRGGYYYPASGQAASVRQALLLELKRLKVDCHYGIGIRSIKKKEEHFLFDTKSGPYESRVCVIATGGRAAKKTGSDGSGIPYIVGFGHKVTDFVPALVQMQGKQAFLREIAGIRADAALSLYVDNTKLLEDRGEVQMTEFGVSGIPAFQVSRYSNYALTEGKNVYVTLDFAPDMTERSLMEFLRAQQECRDCKAEEAFMGLVPAKLVSVLFQEAGLEKERSLKSLQMQDFLQLVTLLKAFRIDIIGSKGFDAAQVCAGGVLTEEIVNETMESRLVPGLYFAGEVVDIDGICGGYNLQWAWSSGWVAGYHGGSSL